jgi:AcrR family transcriptional regulator
MISLKEKTIRLRRSHILAAAITVFAAKGFHRATIRDVALEAGVSDGTIYNYFESKTALLMSELDPMDEVTAASKPTMVPQPDIRTFLLEALRRRFETLTPEMLGLHRVILSEVLINPEVRVLYMERVLKPAVDLPRAMFEAFAASGALQATDTTFALRAITGSVLGLVMLRLLGDSATAEMWDVLPDQLASLLLDGMAHTGPAGGPHDAV